ncbi:type IV secretion system DNA-binding domain-containing protein [bacterium]|nr:type IV secretion system DNA-binding domain-containing protein [bacterium]
MLTREQLFLSLMVAILILGFAVVKLPALVSAALELLNRRRQDGIRIGNLFISHDSRVRHTHIVGATGTGKTILIEQLLFQDIALGGGAIIIDPKGERFFFEKVKGFCSEVGRSQDLHLLSSTFGEESSTWNPCALGSISELQTKFFNSAIYQEPYYAKACEYGLLTAFQKLFEQQSGDICIPDLIRELEKMSRTEKDATLKGLFFDLNNLAQGEWAELLCCTETSKAPVSILEIIQNNKILFVDLPTEGKKVQSSRIGRLLTQEVILVSGMRKRAAVALGNRPFAVYVDEFDAFATESFSTFLNKGRSSNFMIHLAHQTLSDLDIISKSFTGQILGNCNVRFIFRQDDPDDAEKWARFFGTKNTVKSTYRTSSGQATGDASNRETQEFVFSPNVIKNLKTGQCIYSSKTPRKTKLFQVPFRPQSKPIAMVQPSQQTQPSTTKSRIQGFTHEDFIRETTFQREEI